MKKSNKLTEFERQWEDAFKDAEMAPSEGVWDKIDSNISKDEAGYFRKRAFLFKLLAAASIAFALGVSVFSINYYVNHDEAEMVSVQGDGNNENLNFSDSDQAQISDSDAEVKDRDSQEGQISNEHEIPSESVILAQSNNRGILAEKPGKSNTILLDIEDNEPLIVDSDNSREFLTFKEIYAKGIDISNKEDMVYEIDHIYLIPVMPRGSSENKKEKESGLFLAGLDFSTGVFDPNFQQGGNLFSSADYSALAGARVESVNDQLASFNTANKAFAVVRSTGTETEPEIAYSYGANIGYKLSKRIIVQTGIAYRKASTTTTTTGYVEQIGSGTRIPIIAAYQYQLDGLSYVKPISEISLSNQYEFVSVPLRAGYVLLDKKINLTFLAGISSEFFLNNQIVDKSKYLETLSNSSGDGSPYKSIYFNGSLGTMVGYTFAKNYAITLEPSYRFAVNSFTKDDFYLNSYPSSFMLSFGIAYNFR